MTDTVRVRHQQVRLDVAGLCGPRLAPAPDVVLPEHVAVYRVVAHGGDELRCPPGRAGAWEDAALGYLNILSWVLVRVYEAHGGTRAHVDLADGGRAWSRPGPWRWPMHRRGPERSVAAQRAFVAEAGTAAAVYRPVFEQIDDLVQHAETERKAAHLRRAEVIELVAQRPCWAAHAEQGAVHARRTDLPGGPRHDAPPLTARELHAALVQLVPAGTDGPTWDPASRAAVERDCRDAGVEITFADWWDTVTAGHWRRRRAHAAGPTQGTAHHSSHGATYGTSF